MREENTVHVAAVALVLPDKRLVLQRRDRNTMDAPGKLSLFGGRIHVGENPHDAAVRELREETSLTVNRTDIHPIGKLTLPASISAGARNITFHVYSMKITDPDFEVHEGMGAEIYSIRSLLSRKDVSSSTMYTVNKIKENNLWR